MDINNKQKINGFRFSLYIIAIIALVIGVVVVKKITGCLIKSVLLLGIIGLLLYLYFMVYQH